MPRSDVYTFRSGSQAVAATAATPVLSVIGVTTVRGWITGCRVKVGATTAIAGNDLVFQLVRPGNTPTGTTPFNGGAHDLSAPAGLLQGYTTWSTAPTVGTILAEWVVPQTTGSAWVEYPPTDDEWQVPALANTTANTGLHVFVTPTVATSTPVFVDLITHI